VGIRIGGITEAVACGEQAASYKKAKVRTEPGINLRTCTPTPIAMLKKCIIRIFGRGRIIETGIKF
jgi:hypothetical protein